MSIKTLFMGGLIVLGTPLAVSAADMSATWIVKGEFGSDLQYSLFCQLEENTSKIAGPCVTMHGKLLKATGRLTGDTLTFRYDTDYDGGGLTLEYSGDVKPDGTVIGRINTGISTGQFRGSKVMSRDADHSTTWKFDVGFTPEIKYSVLCTFKADGVKIKGPCSIIQGPTLQAKGAVDGSKATFAYDTYYQGRAVHVEYTGEVQADGSMKGPIREGDSEGSFTAARY